MRLLEAPGIAQVFDAPVDVLLDDETCVQPDLVVVGRRATPSSPTGPSRARPTSWSRHCPRPPAIATITSKKRVFEGFGVPEYWVVNPTLGLLTAWRLEDGRYQLRARYDRSSVLTCPDFPAIDVRLLDVFR
jgi:hypothetical protein